MSNSIHNTNLNQIINTKEKAYKLGKNELSQTDIPDKHIDIKLENLINYDIFEKIEKKEFKLLIIRGYIEKNNQINMPFNNKTLCICIKSSSYKLLCEINDFIKIKSKISNDNNLMYYLNYKHINAFDLLYFIYNNINIHNEKRLHSESLYEKYCMLCEFNYNKFNIPKIKFIKENELAIIPTKANGSDVGYDLTIISEFKKLSEKTKLYSTGIKVSPPYGYYTEILPRSSISKSGYMLANSVGIIDSSYNGILLIALTKIDETKPDIELPMKIAQLVIRKFINYELIEVEEFEETSRGEGGFGSSDK